MRKSYLSGAESIGYEGVVHGLFNKGSVELIQHFYTSCNEELISYLKRKCIELPVNVQRYVWSVFHGKGVTLSSNVNS